MEFTTNVDHPVILGDQPRAEYFHRQTLDEGGLLDVSNSPELIQLECLPVGSRIATTFDEWQDHPSCGEFFAKLHAGFIVNSSVNAFAQSSDRHHLIGINMGLVWLLHELWLTLLSHPEFLPEFASDPEAPCPFSSLKAGFNPAGSFVVDADGRITCHAHPRQFNSVRFMFALVMSQMAIEFAFYHELGHLMNGDAAYLRENSDAERLHELESRRQSSALSSDQFQAIEYEADSFAVQVALSNGLMLDYFDQAAKLSEDPQAFSAKEMAYYFWAMSISALMRVFSQQGLSISDYRECTHPHPLLRTLAMGFTVMTSTALRSDPDRKRIIDLCARAPLDLAHYWKEFEIPGYNYDPVADDSLLSEAAEAIHGAGEVLRSCNEERSKFRLGDVDRILTKNAVASRELFESEVYGDRQS